MTFSRADSTAKSRAALRVPAVRWLLLSGVSESLASRGLAVIIGFQLYQVTRSPLALGWLGLVEAVPALGLALLGGHFADRRDRKRIVLVTRMVMLLAALAMSFFSTGEVVSLSALYALVFVSGLARGFGEPAASAFEMQVVPAQVYVNAASWLGSASLGAAMLGPAVGGFAFDLLRAHGAYLLVAALHLLALAAVWRVPVAGTPQPALEGDGLEGEQEPIWDSIQAGLTLVRRDPVLLGSMALDLFAVLFGGAIALLPIFADDILKVGASGLGFLVAAPSLGALAVTLWATRYPPTRNAGRTLLISVAGFGVSIIVFALSHTLWLSLLALAFSGGFDGVSMVIRRSILRLRTPAHLRGRVASVSLLFIGSSNEIGAFESGFAASLLGTVRSVWLGGLVTLAVVGISAWRVPELRRLSLEELSTEGSGLDEPEKNTEPDLGKSELVKP